MDPRARSAGAAALEWCLGLLLLFVVVAVLSPLAMEYYSDICHPVHNSCMSNMNQIAKAMLSYIGEYDDHFPCTRAPGVSGGLQPEQGIETRNGAVPFGGATWVERIDPYVQRGSIEDAKLGVMTGVFNCTEREMKWPKGVGQDTPDWHSYGYNFLYLGLPWSKDSGPKTNPYRRWGFVAGVQRVSRLDSTSDTILLVESQSIWAFPPYTNNGRVLATNRTCISPRHNGKANVAFCDGHVKAVDAAELVTNGRMGKNLQLGRALNNYLWEPVKAHKHVEAAE